MAVSSVPSFYLVGSWCARKKKPASVKAIRNEFPEESGEYRKIPVICPGLIQLRKGFWVGL